jgi:hypothetical protein
VQVAEGLVPDSVQGPLKVPAVLLLTRLNEPVGVTKVLGEESETVTAQDD